MAVQQLNISRNTNMVSTEGKTMLTWIKNLFAQISYQDDIEHFVSSKQPKTTAEVEYWVQYYNQQKYNKGKWTI